MIDPTAIIAADAQLAEAVCIGPHVVIGEEVKIGAGTRVGPGTVIRGPSRIGRNNQIYQFCSIGEVPQDKKYRAGEDSHLEIGDGNVIREFCSVHRGTAGDVGYTRIGNDNWIMAYTHIAHDCSLGNDIVLSNGVQLAGHVRIDDHAAVGGMAGVHQFCSIGSHCFVAASTKLVRDAPPCMIVAGQEGNWLSGVNEIGLGRRGVASSTIVVLRQAFHLITDLGLRLGDLLEKLDVLAGPEVQQLAAFIRSSERGIVRRRRRRHGVES